MPPANEQPVSEDPPFEDALQQLEQLVASLEKGETPLRELVEKFEQGDRLIRACERRLSEAELRIEKLRSDRSGDETEPFAEAARS